MKRKLPGAKEEYKPRKRIIFIGVCFILAFTVILGKAAYLQTFEHDTLLKKAAKQKTGNVTTLARRGTIFDSEHRELAVSLKTISIAANPKKIKNQAEAASILSKHLKIKRSKLLGKLSSGKRFVRISRGTPETVANKIRREAKNLKINGLQFIPEYNRFYPKKTLAAQALGFSGNNGKGLEGLEYKYNDQLSGKNSSRIVLKDAKHRSITTGVSEEENVRGNDIVLTLNETVQYFTETTLVETASKYKAKSGMAVVMVPDTGEILAMAHYPVLNPNTHSEFAAETYRNRLVTDPFEPGSTLKIFLAAAAIDGNYVSMDSIFNCENGKYKIGRDTIHDTHKYDWLTLPQIIKYSSNIGVAKVAEKMGKKPLYDYLTAFGFGSKTNIECPGETPGILASYTKWTDIDTSTIAFGQGISTSAVQLVAATSAIANGGVLMKPYIVKEILSPDGSTLKTFSPSKVKRVISKKTAQRVTRMMSATVNEDGTGGNAALPGYEVCGKTGTAQKADNNGRYKRGKYISSFVGFAPAKNPQITVLVVIDEPQGEYYASKVAAPAFREITGKTLNFLSVNPINKSRRVAAYTEQ